MHHRPAPDHRRVLGHQEAHRHAFDAVIAHRLQRSCRRAHARLAGDAQHARHGRAVDVGVEHADLEADGRQRQREIGGGGRFADAALARGDGDDRSTPGTSGFCGLAAGPGRAWPWPGRGRRSRAAPPALLGGQHRRDRQHAGQRLDRLFRRLAQGSSLGPRSRLDLDRKGDMALAHLQARDHAKADDVLAAVGIAHLGQRRQDSLLGDVINGNLLFARALHGRSADIIATKPGLPA